MVCKYCGSTDIKESDQICTNGMIHLRLDCGRCGRFQKYGRRTENEDFKMPSGTKYAGKTIPEIIRIDRPYAVWASENYPSNNIRQRFKEELIRQDLKQETVA